MSQRTRPKETRLEHLENALAVHSRQRVLHKVLRIKAGHIEDRLLAASIRADLDELEQASRRAQQYVVAAISDLKQAGLI